MGELPFKHACAGICAPAHTCGCLYCWGPWRDWSRTNPFPKRTLIGIFQSAHLYHSSMLGADGKFIAFDCPCCGKHFSSRASLDNEPAIEDENAADRYALLHKGVKHHQALLVCGEMANDPNATTDDVFMEDILHMLMSFVGKAMFEGVGRFITTDEEAEGLNNVLQGKGIMSTRKYTAYKQTAKSSKEERPAFTGNTCQKIVLEEMWRDVVTAFTPPHYLDRVRAMFTALEAWYLVVLLPCAEGYDMSEVDHTKLLVSTAEAFQEGITNVGGKEAAQFPYMHKAVAHLERGNVMQYSTPAGQRGAQQNQQELPVAPHESSRRPQRAQHAGTDGGAPRARRRGRQARRGVFCQEAQCGDHPAGAAQGEEGPGHLGAAVDRLVAAPGRLV